ncbi:hypothetical protein AB0F91_38480 [Amycolatopsis sp. NPDC023774]|uniref:hypothetical protein n=1 Tax=Amycolatopsis sp. NPDC023774 TaxID=3155015 RepID=UPI0033E20BB7
MALGTTGAGETARQEDDEPLLPRTGPLPKPDPVTLNRAVGSRIWQALGAVALWGLVVAATIAGSFVLFKRADRRLTVSGMIALDASAEALLVSGMRAVGRVVDVKDPPRGTPTIAVDHTVGATPLPGRYSFFRRHEPQRAWLGGEGRDWS